MGKMQDGMARVKRQLSESTTQPAPKMDPKIKAALEIGFAYERILGEYMHRPALRFFTGIGTEGINSKTLGFLKKASEISVEHKTDAETYVRAQFYWFHQWFKRPPKIREMVSTKSTAKKNAVWRLSEYLKLGNFSKRYKVYSKSMPTEEIGAGKLDRINQQRLQQLAETWGKSQEEIVQIFALSGVFDQAWLEKNDLYCQLRRSGKL